MTFFRRLQPGSIRWKLVFAWAISVFLPIYFLNRYAVGYFDEFTSKAREDEMVSYAFIAGEQYKSMVLGMATESGKPRPAEFAALLQRYSTQVDARIRILSHEGVVLFDSDVDDPTVGENFSYREEVRQALGGSYKAAWKLTGDGKFVFYYIALPVKHGDEVKGVAFVAGHTGRITTAIGQMVKDHRLALLLALSGAVLLATILAHKLTSRLRKLTRAASEFAKGDARMDLRLGGHDEIGELAEAVSRMAGEIDKRNDYNRDFISTVVHELKMPLTAIKGATELLQQGAADRLESREKFLGNIRYEVDRMIQMVWELTELTKLDVETLRGQKEEIEYCSYVKDMAGRLEQSFEGPRAPMTVSVPEGELTVRIMPGRIEQVLLNLLDNAFRHTDPSGTVTLRVEDGPGESVTTSVEDTGEGIAASNLPKVFGRFFTTQQRDVPGDRGSGLGLAIARSIVENHQGQIGVESTPGKGARFWFEIPRVRGK